MRTQSAALSPCRVGSPVPERTSGLADYRVKLCLLRCVRNLQVTRRSQRGSRVTSLQLSHLCWPPAIPAIVIRQSATSVRYPIDQASSTLSRSTRGPSKDLPTASSARPICTSASTHEKPCTRDISRLSSKVRRASSFSPLPARAKPSRPRRLRERPCRGYRYLRSSRAGADRQSIVPSADRVGREILQLGGSTCVVPGRFVLLERLFVPFESGDVFTTGTVDPPAKVERVARPASVRRVPSRHENLTAESFCGV